MTTPLLCVMCVMKHEELDFYVPGAVPSHFIDDCYWKEGEEKQMKNKKK